MFAYTQGQINKLIFIKGIVKSNLDYNPIANCQVQLTLDNVKTLNTYTNDSGEYEFNLNTPNFTKGEITLKIDENLKDKRSPCGFLISNEKGVFNLDDTAAKITFQKDFLLTPINCHFYLPSICFKKNSTLYDTINSTNGFHEFNERFKLPDSIIFYFAQFLKDYPNVILEIRGNSSRDEKNKTKLSQLRTEKVISDLVKHGIEKERLKGKGFSDKKPLSTPEEFENNDNERKKIILARNRRCSFIILSWDFENDTTKKIETPTYKPAIQKEDEMDNPLPVKPK